MLWNPKNLFNYRPDTDGAAGGSTGTTTSPATSGESQNPTTGETPKTEPNTDLSKTLTTLQQEFADYKTRTNKELAARRLEAKKLLEQLSGEHSQEKGEGGEGQQKPDGEAQANLVALTGQLQTAQSTIEKLTQQIQSLTVQLHVERGARQMGFLHEEDTFRLIDAESVKVGEDGKVVGVEDALKVLMQKYPALVNKRAGETPPDTNGNRGGGGEADATKREQELRSRYNIR